ncbi:MAG: nucleotidyltransferase domain-containing protein [Lachnospiraceae bacterium]|nr:nucleotidyltransferase domain-containing protein [Lachnospiraceae bacterium]
MMEGTIAFDDIVSIVRPLADKYKIQEVYLFGSYARNEATQDSDLDFLVEGGDQFRLTMIFAFAEELRKALNKDVDVFEIHEVNQNSDFYKNIMKERLLVA